MFSSEIYSGYPASKPLVFKIPQKKPGFSRVLVVLVVPGLALALGCTPAPTTCCPGTILTLTIVSEPLLPILLLNATLKRLPSMFLGCSAPDSTWFLLGSLTNPTHRSRAYPYSASNLAQSLSSFFGGVEPACPVCSFIFDPDSEYIAEKTAHKSINNCSSNPPDFPL